MLRSVLKKTVKETAELLSVTRHNNNHNISLYRRYNSVWGWGTSTFPSLIEEEQKKNRKISTPQRIDTHDVFNINPDSGIVVNEFACGIDNSGAVLSDGTCYVWGANKNGQLGLGQQTDVSVPALLTLNNENDQEAINAHHNVRSIHLGSTFSAAVDTNGNLHTFGYGGSAFRGMGWLGHGDGKTHLKPKLVESLVEDGCEVKQVQVGDSHLAVLTTEGELLTAGSGAYGCLGNLETTDQLFLEPVELLAGAIVTQIACGHSFTLALTNDGIVHGFGKNDKGQLGTGGSMAVGMYAMSRLPSPIEEQLENRNVVKIGAGHSHSACITDKGELFIWGMNLYLEPTLVHSITNCVDVACGENYTAVLTEDGIIYSFGKGAKKGVLGHGNDNNLNDPTLVVGMADKTVLRMSAGNSHFACIATERVEGDNSTFFKT